ncbi:hypothetical protein OSSY52_22110 [Tepiditoga spiralis]|uniref:Cation:proton antiporter n=1 Tax=Tepiditoga spiralis TaxID=2108365 RepID=A0A7G1G641_9BACT|nr:monovalent cation/H(+) antiporter subunit G [Tepiditoga spiralis]BBE32070.1 hypothetical protein OSSY52_22110 [Tepiditoga spiralis]
MIADILIIFGLFLFITGSLGFFTMKDIFSQIQAVGISDTVGLFTIVIAFIIKYPEEIGRLLLIGILTLILNPVISHVIAQGASESGLKIGGKEK